MLILIIITLVSLCATAATAQEVPIEPRRLPIQPNELGIRAELVPMRPVEIPIKPNSELTLDRAIQIALRYHPRILQMRSQVGVAMAKVGEARSEALPQVYGTFQNLSGTANSVGAADILLNSVPFGFEPRATGPINHPTSTAWSFSTIQSTYFTGINFSQWLYDFGKVRGFIDQRKYEHDAAVAKLAFTELEIIFEVEKRYWWLLASHEIVRVYQEALNARNEELRLAEILARTDLRPKLDVYIYKSDVERARFHLVEALNAEADAKVALDNAMGLSGSAPPYRLRAQWSDRPVTQKIEDAVRLAFKLRPDITMLQDLIQSADRQIAEARSDFFPTFYAYGNYMQAGYGGQPGPGVTFAPNYAVGIVANWPIFNGFNTVSQVAEAKYRKQAFRHALEDTQQRIILETQTALLNWQASLDEIRSAKAARDASQLEYELAQVRYRRQLGNAVDVQVAEQRFVADSVRYINSLYAYEVARAAFEEATGQSLRKAHLLPEDHSKPDALRPR